MTDIQPRELLDLALAAASRAGDMLVRDRPDDLGVAATKSSAFDVVTEMDTASERMIIADLLAARPEDGVLGEEGGERTGASGVRWVIDPIDGTVNFLHRIPAWSVSIAAEVDGVVMAGVVHAPALGETFLATRGGGAFLRTAAGERQLTAPDAVPLSDALVATGFGYQRENRRRQGEVAGRLLGRIRDIRRPGSAALDLCGVGCGRTNAYYEQGINAWDMAAGALVATEAGARVGGLGGAPASVAMTVAAREPLFDELCAALTELSAGIGDGAEH